MKSLVVGGAGFVGAYLIQELKKESGEIYVTKMAGETIAGSDVQVMDLDILDRGSIEKTLAEIRPDYIYHLAAQSSVAVSWQKPEITVDVNIKGAVNLLEAVRKEAPNARVLLIGSGEEYGHIHENEIPVIEDNPLRPGNIYAATKACQNMLGRIYADAYHLQIMMVRAFNHIGPNQAPIFVVADFCKQVAEIEAGRREPVIRVGNLSAKRDFTDVRDVVRAYTLLMKYGKIGCTYNVGSGRAVAIEEILQMILEESKVQIEVQVDEERLRPVDVPMIVADVSQLQQCTGWKPEIELRETLVETLGYWRDKVQGIM